MQKILYAAELFGCISGIAGGIILFVRPLRERVMGYKRHREGEMCLLRAEMLRIYYHNKDSRKIRQFELENLVMMYNAYKTMGGNSFIDILYKEICTWEVIT